MQLGAAVLSYARHVMNLIMFNLDVESTTYTDTDSITVNELDCKGKLSHLICNRDDAAMGTLKNDHLDGNGTNPRIIFSMIGAKKVKCHITLNAEGEIKIFNTFKGLHLTQTRDNDGAKLNPDYLEKITTSILYQINRTGHPDPVRVQSWERNLQSGVTISNHDQTFNSKTYLGDFKGTDLRVDVHGTTEVIIPLGSYACPRYPIVFHPSTRDYMLCDRRQAEILDIYSGVETTADIGMFFYHFFKSVPELYEPPNEEYKEIVSLFSQIQSEVL